MSLVISIDGNIGAGKTTIMDELKKKYNNTRVYQHYYREIITVIVLYFSTMVLLYIYDIPIEMVTAIYFIIFFTINKNICIFMLRFHLKIIFIDEPVNEWQQIIDHNGTNIIQQYYNNPNKFALSFQLLSIITRVNKIREIIKKYPNAIIVSERSIFTDKYIFTQMLHDMGNIDEIQYKIYKMIFREYKNNLPPHIFFYLHSNPQYAFENVKKRARMGEIAISLPYLEKCHNYHELLFTKITPELTIDVDNYDYFPINKRGETSQYEYILQKMGNVILYSIFERI